MTIHDRCLLLYFRCRTDQSFTSFLLSDTSLYMRVPQLMVRTSLDSHVIWYDVYPLDICMLGETEGDETTIPLGINSMQVDVKAKTSGKRECDMEMEGGMPSQSSRDDPASGHHL